MSTPIASMVQGNEFEERLTHFSKPDDNNLVLCVHGL